MDKGLWKWISSSTIVASLCCLPSVVMVMFGLASVSTAAALSDTLYWGKDGYWWFRPAVLAAAAIMVIIGLISYFRNQGVCTLDDVKKRAPESDQHIATGGNYRSLCLPFLQLRSS